MAAILIDRLLSPRVDYFAADSAVTFSSIGCAVRRVSTGAFWPRAVLLAGLAVGPVHGSPTADESEDGAAQPDSKQRFAIHGEKPWL